MGNSSIIMYTTEDGLTKIETTFDEDTVWLSLEQMAELFQRDKSTISRHIKNIFEEGELQRNSVVANFATTASDGKTYQVDYYNLDVIISVGYRVKSHRGTQVRIWAMGILKEYMKKGFALNDERLRNPREFGADYFDELLERIRDIRASEKRVYQKVKEIFALSVDYDSKSQVAQNFFKSVQNKLEYAATGHTAPELIANRADAFKDNMGLTSFKGVKVRRGDVTVAKNYMTHEEISTLNLIVNMYLDYAELQAKGHNPMHMADWESKLGDFLRFNGREVLENFGTVKREVAEKLALEQYEQYDANRRVLEASDDVDELTADVKRLKP